jgi:hypothetical protein
MYKTQMSIVPMVACVLARINGLFDGQNVEITKITVCLLVLSDTWISGSPRERNSKKV